MTTTMTRGTVKDRIGVKCLDCGEYVYPTEAITRDMAALWNRTMPEPHAQAVPCLYGNGWHLVNLPPK